MHRHDFQLGELFVAVVVLVPFRASASGLTNPSLPQAEDAPLLSRAALLERTARPLPTSTPSPALPVDASSTLAHQDTSRRPTPRPARRLPGLVRRDSRSRVEADASKTRLRSDLLDVLNSQNALMTLLSRTACALERAPQAHSKKNTSPHTYPLSDPPISHTVSSNLSSPRSNLLNHDALAQSWSICKLERRSCENFIVN